ncbi:MAG TPA: hypothetical protein PK395_13230, partial [bacterium]|nr:hypothetical protein [bacterium]
ILVMVFCTITQFSVSVYATGQNPPSLVRAIWVKEPALSQEYFFKTEEDEPDIIYKGYKGPGEKYIIQFDLFLRELIESNWTEWLWSAHNFSGCQLRSDVTWSSMGPCTAKEHEDNWARYEFESAAAYTITGRHHGFDCTGDDITGGDVTVVVYVVKVDLDIDGISEENEESVGGLVVKNLGDNNPPRKKITIQKALPTSWGGDVILTRGDTKIKVFTAATGGTEITFNGTDNKFANSSLPLDLYVEGNTHSSTMRDTGLDVKGQVAGEDIVNCVDSVDFTVLEVGTPTVKLTGSVSDDNDKRNNYWNYAVPHTYSLGMRIYYNGAFYWMGYGEETWATVYPTNFSYPGYSLYLDRDHEHHSWIGDGTSTIDDDEFSVSIPKGNDTSLDSLRDDSPTANGIIYDLDMPGLIIPDPVAQNEIYRFRANFKSFATLTLNGTDTHVRCSPIQSHFVRFSMKQLDAPTGTNWAPIIPADVPNDGQVGAGPTNLSWNLQ